MLVIFDLDGTLLDTIADLGEACNHALNMHGFPTFALEEYPKKVGNGVNKLLERALPDGHKDMETVMALKHDFIAYYDTHNCVHTRPYEDIKELVVGLKAAGHKLAVASNKYQAATVQLVEHYFGVGTFDIILGEREGVERKPDPQIVYDIMAALGMRDKGQILYVGDSDVDMTTAANAGLRSVACTWGFCTRQKLESCCPTYMIEKADELKKLV